MPIESTGADMRTTLDLPGDLVEQPTKITKARTKAEMAKTALTDIVEQTEPEKMLRYHGRL